MIFKDQLNRVLELKETPRRIVSLVPSQTELLCDLGLKDSIVGVTKFCVHPEHIRNSKTVVGGTKQINVAKIKALTPDVILCNKEENTLAIVEELEGVAPIHVSDIVTIDDCLKLICMYGELFNCKSESNKIISSISEEQRRFDLFICNYLPLKTVYFIWKDPWMIAADNTFINYLLAINKYENAFDNLKRYPEVNLNSEKFNDIELIMLSSEPFPFKEKHIKELGKEFPNAKITLVDGEMFSWYGSRLTKAFSYFKTLRTNINS